MQLGLICHLRPHPWPQLLLGCPADTPAPAFLQVPPTPRVHPYTVNVGASPRERGGRGVW